MSGYDDAAEPRYLAYGFDDYSSGSVVGIPSFFL